MDNGNCGSSKRIRGANVVWLHQNGSEGYEKVDVVIQAFQTSLVWKQLSPFLSSRDLLNLSLVNKSFNLQARYLLREERKVVVRIKPIRPCYSLKQLDLLLESKLTVPFYGLHIQTFHPNPVYNLKTHECLRGHNVAELYPNILKSSFKCLKLEWSHQSSCGAVQLLSRLLQDGPSLKHLAIYKLPYGVSRPPNMTIINNVQVLEVTSHPKIDYFTLISMSHHLKEIRGEIPPDLLSKILAMRRGHLVTELQLLVPATTAAGDLAKYERTYIDFLALKPKLSRLVVLIDKCLQPRGSKLVAKILRKVLDCSRSSLKYIHGNFRALHLLLSLKANMVLPNVRHLKFGLQPGCSIHALQFSRHLPNMKVAEIYHTNIVEDEEDENNLKMLRLPLRFTTSQVPSVVQELILCNVVGRMEDEFTIESLAQAFPHVIELTSDNLILGTKFWSLFSSLKYLTLTQIDARSFQTIEAALCGLSLPELSDSKTIDCWRGLVLPPSKPSLKNFPNLTRLRICINSWSAASGISHNDLPQTDALDTFVGQAMPGLKIEIIPTDHH